VGKLVVSLIACVAMLGGQAPYALSSTMSTPTVAESPSPGDVFPAFDAESVNGGVHRVEFPKGSRTVLLFFLSSCSVCHKMIPEWNRAYERRPKTLQVFGVLLDREPPGFFAVTPLAFPVLRAPSREFLQARKISRVPVTLRVGQGGKVEDVAVGIVDPIRLGEIFRP
jgi:hypothetical protein